MAVRLRFFGWWRSSSAQLMTTGLSGGRRSGAITLTAADLDDNADRQTRTMTFDLVGPRDVAGLAPGAVVNTFPSSGSSNVDVDKAVYAELAAPDLPWRYTLAEPQGPRLRPWIILLVGTADEIAVQGTVATIAPTVLADLPPARFPTSAHVEQDIGNPGGRPIARLVTTRPLLPDREHRAVIVPAFDAAGNASWAAGVTTSIQLPAYYSWSFRTRDGGDFAVIARRLHPHIADAGLGSARLQYGPLPAAEPVTVTGALAAPNRPAEAAPSIEVTADLLGLTQPFTAEGNLILGLPEYASSWPPAEGDSAPPTGWRNELRSDPRARGIAGLGAQAGVRHQEMLAIATSRMAGAYEETSERLRRLRLGLLSSSSLWQRRMSADGARQLSVLGPALRNVLTTSGPVTEELSRPDRALSGSLLSTAAKRAWRSPALPGAGAAAGRHHDDAIRDSANPVTAPTRDATPVAHTDELAQLLHTTPIDEVAIRKPPVPSKLLPGLRSLVDGFDRTGLDTDTTRILGQSLTAVGNRLQTAQPVSILGLLGLLDSQSQHRPTATEVRKLAAGLNSEPDSDDLAQFGAQLTRKPRPAAANDLDLDRSAASIAVAFDPTTSRPALIDRVLDTISDRSTTDPIADNPLAPVEMRPTLRLPAWQFLRDQFPQWLLPGGGELPGDTVVGLGTNPAFIDTFLLGLNAQILAELRFRNAPILPGWTPLRTFWARSTAAGPINDITDITDWPDDSAFGADNHLDPAATGTDLVLLFKTPLFREYPGTLVFLVPATAKADGTPDWAAEPVLGSPTFPSFQGRLGPDEVFFGFDADPASARSHWVVLAETVHGRRFWNEANADHRAGITAAGDGAALAKNAVARPRRVLIRGDKLVGL